MEKAELKRWDPVSAYHIKKKTRKEGLYGYHGVRDQPTDTSYFLKIS